jgi:hypothetical protein
MMAGFFPVRRKECHSDVIAAVVPLRVLIIKKSNKVLDRNERAPVFFKVINLLYKNCSEWEFV